MKLHQLDYHRNGVCGAGFYAILFNDPEQPGGEGSLYNMLATVFDRKGHVSIINTAMLEDAGVSFGYNSWRGDHYEPQLREWIKDHKKSLISS